MFGNELSPKEAVLCFCRAHMVIVDELRNRQRVKTLDFIDFLEALCRYVGFKDVYIVYIEYIYQGCILSSDLSTEQPPLCHRLGSCV